MNEKRKTPLEAELGFKLAITFQVMDRILAMEIHQKTGLTPTQGSFLHVIYDEEERSIDDLMQIFKRQHHSLSTLITRMHKKGLIMKRIDPATRKILVKITPKGKELFNPAIVDAKFQFFFGSLSKEEKIQLADVLDRLSEGGVTELHDMTRPYS